MFNALHDCSNEIRVVNARHDRAAYMAFDMLSQPEPSVRSGSGPGILNTTAALSTAYACNSRVLAITGQIPSSYIGRELGMLHEIPNQLSVLEGLTKFAKRINYPSDAPAIVSEAFKKYEIRKTTANCYRDADGYYATQSEVTLRKFTDGYSPPAADPDLIKEAALILGAHKKPCHFRRYRRVRSW